MSTPRVFFYVQHLLGIGHLVRASRIASALRQEGFDVAVAAGGCPVEGFPGPGIRTLLLPPLRAGSSGFSDLEDCEGKTIGDEFKTARRGLLGSALEAEQPDIVIIEAFPFGRRMMRFELVPLLENAATLRSKPLVACSLRDILQENARPGRAEETLAAVDRHFDLVLVHGDPGFARLEETFPAATAIGGKTVYTGFVCGPPPRPTSNSYRVIVSAGGGAAGAELVTASLQALKSLAWARPACIVAGPQASGPAIETLKESAPEGVDVFAFRKDLPDLLGEAELSISQAGYNTVCDILQAGCRSLLVPFASGGETEQTARAAKLKSLGAAEVIAENAVTAENLAAAAGRLIGQPKPARHGLNLDGARQTARILRERLLRRGRSA